MAPDEARKAVTDWPILFSAPMIRALLGGRKSQTRRLAWGEKWVKSILDVAPERIMRMTTQGAAIKVPTIWQKANPGDRLWVRETFARRADGLTAYRAGPHPWDVKHDICRWRPSIHMFRWMSRLTLVVTDVRTEQLLDISEDDARAEGFEDGKLDDGWAEPRPIADMPGWEIQAGDTLCSAAGMFQHTWSKLHPDWDGYSSPEVVALTFTTHQMNINAMGEAA